MSGKYSHLLGKLGSPAAPPPAAPPPPPPPSDTESVVTVGRDDLDEAEFLQDSGSNFNPPSAKKQRSAPKPKILNYGSTNINGSKNSKHRNNVNDDDITDEMDGLLPRVRGDASIRPNTGHTNDEYGGIGSLTETVFRLRWATIATCITSIIWEGFAFPTRLLVHAWVYPAKVVLGGYLAFFSLLLLGVELNAPLRDTVGILYYPMGRALLLIFMSGMCFGILQSWWEVWLGIAYILCGGGYIYAYCHFPEYRRWQSYDDNKVWDDVKVAGRSAYAWANPNAPATSAVTTWGSDSTEEGRSLLTTL